MILLKCFTSGKGNIIGLVHYYYLFCVYLDCTLALRFLFSNSSFPGSPKTSLWLKKTSCPILHYRRSSCIKLLYNQNVQQSQLSGHKIFPLFHSIPNRYKVKESNVKTPLQGSKSLNAIHHPHESPYL